MRALQLTGPGQARIVELPLPQPAEGEVVVQVEGVTTCPHWDMTLWTGKDIFDRPAYPRYPLVAGRPGHEMAGRVVAVGRGVEGLAEGDRVASIFDSGEAQPGFYAEYAPARAAQLLRVPEHLDVAAVASLELAQCVAVSFQRAGDLTGLRVGISGLGPAGLIAVQMARALGAAQVVGFEIDAGRFAQARALGADRVVAPDTAEYAALAALPAADQLDLSIDCIGVAASTQSLMRVTRARVLIFGVPHGAIQFGLDEWVKGLQVEGYARHNRAAGEMALDLITAGTLRLKPLVSARLPLHRYGEGVDLLLSRQALKILYLPGW